MKTKFNWFIISLVVFISVLLIDLLMNWSHVPLKKEHLLEFISTSGLLILFLTFFLVKGNRRKTKR